MNKIILLAAVSLFIISCTEKDVNWADVGVEHKQSRQTIDDWSLANCFFQGERGNRYTVACMDAHNYKQEHFPYQPTKTNI
ncbi:hypothetical protein AwWohl_09180 [Gammaproteobacteria bacterium]|nr:hypothetical protein AwWohl_09180 [Gammaproteobacteria bacterium]